MNGHCPICRSPAEGLTLADADQITCAKCGSYKITGTALKLLEIRASVLDRTRLSEHVRRFVEQADPYTAEIDSNTILGLIAAASG